MRVTTLHGTRDIRLEERPEPTIEQPTDAIVRVVRACICGSDLWPYRGENDITPGQPIGHEVIGVVEDVGSSVTAFSQGDFVVVPFDLCDNTCPHCRAGMQAACVNVGIISGGQGELVRVTQADGSLVAVPGGQPDDAMLPHLLALSDVMATGWHAAVAAGVRPGGTVAVVGDGAVGLCGVIAAQQMGASRIIVLSRHKPRQKLAHEFGATDIVEVRGKEAKEAVRKLTEGIGADAVLECVGTNDAMGTAFAIARPGSTVGFVGVPHEVNVPVGHMFGKNIGLAGGMAPVRKYLPELMELALDGIIQPGKVFDLSLPLDQVADGYKAMDERTAIKVMLTP